MTPHKSTHRPQSQARVNQSDGHPKPVPPNSKPIFSKDTQPNSDKHKLSPTALVFLSSNKTYDPQQEADSQLAAQAATLTLESQTDTLPSHVQHALEGSTNHIDTDEGYEEYSDEDEGNFRIYTGDDGVFFYGATGTSFASHPQHNFQPNSYPPSQPAHKWSHVVKSNLPAEEAAAIATAAYGPSTGSHYRATDTRPVCHYFLQGTCRFGDRCRYSHNAETQSSTEQEIQAAELEASKDLDCHICFENVMQRGQRFGILTGCTHSFCLDCIRNWRANIEQAKDSLRMCPLCRVPSYFIVPSVRMVTDPDRKAKLVEEYKQNVQKIPCKHFDQGRGTCPFGSSCFFAHIYPDGRREEHVFRTALDAEGNYDLVKQIRLDEFLVR